jgi:hypothetical protein
MLLTELGVELLDPSMDVGRKIDHVHAIVAGDLLGPLFTSALWNLEAALLESLADGSRASVLVAFQLATGDGPLSCKVRNVRTLKKEYPPLGAD